MFKAIFLTVLLLFTVELSQAQEGFLAGAVSERDEKQIAVIVDKGASRIYLVELESGKQRLVHSADIITGAAAGAKTKQGDLKTPEGVYYIVSYMNSEKMHALYGSYAAIYGSGAFPLNYPNPVDRIYKYTGYGVWMHGLNPEGHKPATEGCVAMENVDFDRFAPLLAPKMPVIIADKVSFIGAKEYELESAKLKGILSNFLTSWSSNDYEGFEKFVHPSYKSYSASNAKTFLASKKQLMQLYPDKLITADNITVYSQNTNMVFDYNQFYCAENVMSYGNKRMYFVPEEGVHKLIYEELNPLSTSTYLEKPVKEFLEDWRKAWASKDIDAYMSFYGDDFASRNAWQEHKEKIFEANNELILVFDNIKLNLAGRNSVRITFKQDYKSDTLSDTGMKTLVIKGCPGSYKIISEDWRAL